MRSLVTNLVKLPRLGRKRPEILNKIGIRSFDLHRCNEQQRKRERVPWQVFPFKWYFPFMGRANRPGNF